MPTVLVASKSFGSGLSQEERLALFAGSGLTPRFSRLEEAGPALAEADALLVGIDKITGVVLEKAPALRAVIKYGVGTDNIDIPAARERGIQVLNLPGVNSDAVAEMALSLLLAVCRRTAEGAIAVREGQWPRMIGMAAQGKTLGIFGTGSIGAALAKMTRGLDMELLGCDVAENAAFRELGGRYVDFDTLLAQSDIISIHAPLLASTRHLFSHRAFGLMKETAVLINTSRGPLVDEDALYQALTTGQIRGAGLDVFEAEPPQSSPLIGLDNVVCTPHVAAFTVETLRRMDRLCVQKLRDALLS